MVDNKVLSQTPDRLARRPSSTVAHAEAISATTGALIDASVAPNTRDAYERALRQLHEWLADSEHEADDAGIAAYLGHLFQIGRAPATAAMVVAAVAHVAKRNEVASPVGSLTRSALAGYRREATDRGRGQAAPCTADNLAAILATADRPRKDGRGWESERVAAERGAVDKAIAALLFQGALRRSEVAALQWRDVTEATTPGAILVTVRRSKTDQEGAAADVRYLKNGAADAVLALRPEDADPGARVFGLTPRSICRRFTAAAAAAGIEARLTAHSGRVGLASELTARGASTTEVMLAGAWKTARMVAHYSAGASAERGAVARYL